MAPEQTTPAFPPAARGRKRQASDQQSSGLAEAQPHFGGQNGCTQVGVTWALYNLPSTPQKLTLFTPVALPLEHIGPGRQGALAFFLRGLGRSRRNRDRRHRDGASQQNLRKRHHVEGPPLFDDPQRITWWNRAHKVLLVSIHRGTAPLAALRFAAPAENVAWQETQDETQHRTLPHHPYRQPAAARRPDPDDVRQGGRRAGRPAGAGCSACAPRSRKSSKNRRMRASTWSTTANCPSRAMPPTSRTG